MLIRFERPKWASPAPRGAGDRPVFVALSSYAEKDIVKQAGFRWDPQLLLHDGHKPGMWWTADATLVANLLEYCDESAIDVLRPVLGDSKASRRAHSDADFPRPEGLDYLPFQKAGIEYALERQNTLIGDEMGLGKTIQAIGVINATPDASKILVVCPASLKLNWRRELRKWLVNQNLTVGVATTQHLPPANITVINYEAVVKHQAWLHAIEWDIVIVDEAHYVKTPKSNRSKAVYKLKAKRRLCLTGTPIVNRPQEVFPLLKWLDPETWTWKQFERRYLPPKDYWGGRDNTGRNLGELQERMRRSVLIRRLKSDVLTELPPKRRQVLEFEPKDARQHQLVAAERARFEEAIGHSIEGGITDEEFRSAFRSVKGDTDAPGISIGELSQLRHDTALAKVPTVVAHVCDLLDETPKVILFAHHRDVLTGLYEGLTQFGASILTGDTPIEERQRLVDSFQNDDSHRVFVASILAAGVGLTLTAANHVVFAELDWVPGNLKQAEDRAHRIGSEGHESINVQYLVLEGSLDAYIANLVAEKIATIEQALDVKTPEAIAAEAVLGAERDAEVERLKTLAGSKAKDTSTRPGEVRERYLDLPGGQRQVDALVRCTQILSGLDPDRAGTLNGVGWNKFDGSFGHSLAEQAEAGRAWTDRQARAATKLVRKYVRQLPPALYALAVEGKELVEA